MGWHRPPDAFLFSDQVPSCCFLLDEDWLKHNANLLHEVSIRSGAKILLALKAFAAWSCFPLLSRKYQGPLWGTCASSVDEARLGREEFGGEVHTFACAYEDQEFAQLLRFSDHLVFNSLAQWRHFAP
ncbi:MAG: carboxynorspermidine decarboxylase, partial [Desulfovibrio sp.]|nr:carboxynorspermidine decarboxylase [Desulfovibrio sp.]